MGFDPVVEIAAEHGDGVAELLDEIIARLPPAKEAVPVATDETAVAIVGRPNVGKSSLVNRLVREERVMVSELPGHDARHRGRAAAVAQADVSAGRHRRHAPARPGRGVRTG